MSDSIIIERFSKKRYEAYKERGILFHVVNSQGELCEVRAFDCGVQRDQVFVERIYKYNGKVCMSACYANQKNGCAQSGHNCNLFIYLGPWFDENNLVVSTKDGIAGREIFFWKGIIPKEKQVIRSWSIYLPYADLRYSSFTEGWNGLDLKRNYHFRLATDKDIADYHNALRNHRITWEDDGLFYHYPHVGDHYYEIFFNHGVADFRECVCESEETRPEISRLIMECNLTVHLEIRERRVRKRVREINKALGLKDA